MFKEAQAFVSQGRYEIALNKLSAAKICNTRDKKYDSLIVEIYKDINRQKDLAVTAQKSAEQSLEREREAKLLETAARKEALRQKDNVQAQLLTNYWNNSQTAISNQNYLPAVFFAAEALSLARNERTRDHLLMDIDAYLPQIRLSNIFNIGSIVLKAGFSADGRYFFTVSNDSLVRIWNTLDDKKPVSSIRFGCPVSSVSFNPDGSRVVVTPDKGATGIWATATGKKENGIILKGYESFSQAEFSEDGRKVLTVDYAENATIWDAVTGEDIIRIPAHVNQAWFSKDASKLLSILSDNTVRIWKTGYAREAVSSATKPLVTDSGIVLYDAVRNLEIGAEMKHPAPVEAAYFIQDEKEIVTLSSGIIRRWNAATGAQLQSPLDTGPSTHELAFNRDGKTMAVIGDFTASFWDVTSRKPIGRPMKHEGDITSASLSPDGKLFLTAGKDGIVHLWNAQNGEPLGAPVRHAGLVNSAVFSKDGKMILTASNDGTVRVWKLAAANVLRPARVLENAGSNAAFSPNGKSILGTGNYNTALTWNVETGMLEEGSLRDDKIIGTSAHYLSAEFSPDGKRIVTGSSDHSVRIWDAVTKREMGQPIKLKNKVRRVVFSPDGKRILTASDDSTARVWDAVSLEPVTPPLRHTGYVFDARFSPDQKMIITASSDHTVRFWNAVTGEEQGQPLRHDNEVITAIYSRDGKYVLTTSVDLSARIWDAHTRLPTGVVIRHNLEVFDGDFSPDGTLIATASKDGTARIWETATGRPIGPAMEHNAIVSSVRFSPDGTALLTAAWDNNAYLWQIEGDLDISPSLFSMQAVALTGGTFNTSSGQIQMLKGIAWKDLAAQYFSAGREHYRNCRYRDYNLWARFFPAAAEEIYVRKQPVIISPSDRAALLFREAKVEEQNQHFEQAEKAYKESIQLQRLLTDGAPGLLSDALFRLGVMYMEQHRFTESEMNLSEALRAQTKHGESPTAAVRETGQALAALYNKMLETYSFDAFKNDSMRNFPGNEPLLVELSRADAETKSNLFTYYANSSWYLLFAGKYEQSIEAGQKALELYGDQVWVKNNMAHAMLLLGRYKEAISLYTEMKPLKNDEGVSYSRLCLDDLDELEKHGMTHKDFARAREFLKN